MRAISILLLCCASAFGQGLDGPSAAVFNFPASAGGYNPSTDGTTIEYLDAYSSGFSGLTTGKTFSNWVHTVGIDFTNGANNAAIYGRYISAWTDGNPIVAFTNASGATYTYVSNTIPGQPISSPYTITVKFQFFNTNTQSYVYDGGTSGNVVSLRCGSPPFLEINVGPTTVISDTTILHTLFIVYNGASGKYQVDGNAPVTFNTGTPVNLVNAILGCIYAQSNPGAVYIRAYQIQSGDQSSQWNTMYSQWYSTR